MAGFAAALGDRPSSLRRDPRLAAALRARAVASYARIARRCAWNSSAMCSPFSVTVFTPSTNTGATGRLARARQADADVRRACDSPGPFTTQPMTATCIVLDAGIARRARPASARAGSSGSSSASSWKNVLVVRPQPGQAITSGANERRPIVCSISCATIDLARAVAAGLGRERHADRVADAFLQQHRHRGGGSDDALRAHAGFGEPEVQRVVAARGEIAIDRDQVLHRRSPCTRARCGRAAGRSPRRAPRSRAPKPTSASRITASASSGSRAPRVLVHQPREQLRVEAAPVHADAHRLAVAARELDHRRELLVALRAAADVAGIDAVLRERLGAVGKLRRAAGGR